MKAPERNLKPELNWIVIIATARDGKVREF